MVTRRSTRRAMTVPGCCARTRVQSAPRNQSTNTNAYGTSAQVTNTDELFGLRNHFVASVSFDGAQTLFSANSLIGGLTPLERVFVGPSVLIDDP
jgi:iron complex outermembrane receptor protein